MSEFIILGVALVLAFAALWHELRVVAPRKSNSSRLLSEAQKKAPPPDEGQGDMDIKYGGDRLP